jgi:hypothetical protein
MTETLGTLVGTFDEVDLELMDIELWDAMMDAHAQMEESDDATSDV